MVNLTAYYYPMFNVSMQYVAFYHVVLVFVLFFTLHLSALSQSSASLLVLLVLLVFLGFSHFTFINNSTTFVFTFRQVKECRIGEDDFLIHIHILGSTNTPSVQPCSILMSALLYFNYSCVECYYFWFLLSVLGSSFPLLVCGSVGGAELLAVILKRRWMGTARKKWRL